MTGLDSSSTPSPQQFARLMSELATRDGYDLTPSRGGRAALAKAAGMSPSAISRMLRGETLPMPHQLEGLARAVHTDVRTLLVAAGVISERSWPEDAIPDVRSVTHRSRLSPEEACDRWGITDPAIRQMLLSTVREAMRLQQATSQAAPTTAQ
ncbi:helix-turn-helix domain-containing protein [Streptomyces sp. CA-253872]|uniref:helix-turn-helix domain-containing protein n=1 Tax=Streptomyces sp. CA-253872 TaxID=3240067 RepID=UPI003D905E27